MDLNRDLTPEIFANYMAEIGENFLDDYGCEHIDFKIFGGILNCKRAFLPEGISRDCLWQSRVGIP